MVILTTRTLASQPEEEVTANQTTPKNFRMIKGDEFVNFTRNNFDEEGFLVFFGTDWCGHCKNFKPIFMQTADVVLEREGARPLFVYHSVEKDSDHVSKLFRVSGYPTIIYVLKNRLFEFDGKREEGLILEWLDKVKEGKEGEGKIYPDQLPSVWEEIVNGAEELYRVLKMQFKYNKLIFFALVSCFGLLMILCVATIIQLCSDDGGSTVDVTDNTFESVKNKKVK